MRADRAKLAMFLQLVVILARLFKTDYTVGDIFSWVLALSGGRQEFT